MPGILYIEPFKSIFGFIVVLVMGLGGFFMTYIIAEEMFKNLIKKDKDVENKFSFSSFLGLIFYFGVGCFFSSVMWSGFIK